MLQPLQLGGLHFHIPLEHRPALVRHQPVFPADGRKALIGVVLPQGQPVLAPAGHHPVGVHDALGHQIVHQRAQIAGVPAQHQLGFAQRGPACVQARQQALGGGLLIAGGAVELPGPVQALHRLALQRGGQRGGVHTVVLNGIGGPHDLQLLKAHDGMVHGVLHVLGQAGAEALQIHLLGVLAAGLHKHLVAILVGKAHDLILNAGAVAGADALDQPAIQRASADVFPDDPVGFGVGVGNVALHLVVRVTGLALKPVKRNAAPVHPGRCTGLEPAQGQARGP